MSSWDTAGWHMQQAGAYARLAEEWQRLLGLSVEMDERALLGLRSCEGSEAGHMFRAAELVHDAAAAKRAPGFVDPSPHLFAEMVRAVWESPAMIPMRGVLSWDVAHAYPEKVRACRDVVELVLDMAAKEGGQ